MVNCKEKGSWKINDGESSEAEGPLAVGSIIIMGVVLYCHILQKAAAAGKLCNVTFVWALHTSSTP